MKKLVILGGGFAGAKIAKALENKFEVTLIDSKDYYEFTPGILRSIVKPSHLKKIQIMHNHYLKKANIIIECVKEVRKNYVLTSKGKVKFDYLVIALGSSYNSPFKEKEIIVATREVHLRKYYKELCKTKNITIVGGGIVGVELAGEISDFYKNKEITLIQKHEKLIERNHDKTISYADNFLRKKGVRIIYGEEVKEYNKKVISTDKGTKIKSDLTFICTGITPNSEPLKKNMLKYLDKKGYVNVNKYLQINGCENIFAAGDITNIQEEKLAQNAEKQACIVIKNLINIKENKILEKYNSKPRIMIISLGRFNGILQYKNIVITGIIPGLLKNFVEWKAMIKYK